MKKISAAAILILLSLIISLHAQDSTTITKKNFWFGGFAGANYNMYLPNFRQLPEVPCCSPLFNHGDGWGFNLGLLFGVPISDRFNFEIRGGYFNRNGTMTTDEFQVVNLNGDSANGEFEHKINAKLASFALEPLIGYRIWKGLSIQAGLHAGLVVTKSYDQVETLILPAQGTFENGLRTRLPSSGNIPNAASFEASVMAGLNYEIPLNHTDNLFLVPEIFFNYGLNDVASDVTWKVNMLRFGVALKYSPLVNKIPPGQEREPEGTTPPPIAEISAVGVNADSVTSPIVKFRVEEFLSSGMKPLLTYIFFDENSSELPARYVKNSPAGTSLFDENKIAKQGTLEAYYNILDIIGSRMRKNPDAKIAIEGCNDNTGPELGNKGLSKKRAETVKDYLENVWGIEPDRLIVGSRNLPQEPSDIYKEDGIEENRRVEITTNKWEIIAPLMYQDTLRVVNPPVVRFMPKVNTGTGIKSWKVTAGQDGKELTTFNGTDTPPDSIDWAFERDQNTIPRKNDKLDYQLFITDSAGKSAQSEIRSLPVEQITIQQKRRDRVADKYIDRYSLIIFNFDKAKLSYFNSLVVDLIKKKVQPNSTVIVAGHTDRMGNADYNDKLSKARAQVAADEFSARGMKVEGWGEAEQLYDNDLPEGRFYCRRVDVTIMTPVE